MLLLLLLIFLSVGSLQAQAITISSGGADSLISDTVPCQDDDFVQAYLMVMEPANSPFSIFGHAALHLRCKRYDMDYVFSYENDRLGDNIGQQLRSGLHMGFLRVPTDTYLQTYEAEGRGVKEYELNLSLTAKQELWRILDAHVVLDADLPFDYEQRGCAVTCVHWVTEALQGVPICYAPWEEKFSGTRRELAYIAAYDTYPWNWWVATTCAGTRMDKQVALPDKLLIPTDLVSVWQQATVEGRPLLGKEPQVLVPSRISHTTPWCKPWMVALLLLLLAIGNLWWGNRYVEWFFLGMVTCLGVLLTYLLFSSSLPCTEWNWLIIPFNLLPILLWQKRRRWLLPYWGVVGVWGIGMALWPHYLVDESMLLLTAAWLLIGLRPYLQNLKNKTTQKQLLKAK